MKHPIHFFLLGVWLILSGCNDHNKNLITKNHVFIPGTHIAINPPAEFELASDFNGFINNKNGATITLLELQGAFEPLSKTFSKKGFADVGVKLIHSSEIEINGFDALLVEAQDSIISARTKDSVITDVFHKWMLLLGRDSTSCYLLEGNFKKQFAQQLSEKIKNSLQGAVIDTTRKFDDLEGINFNVDFSETKFKLAKVYSQTSILYNVDGNWPTKDTDTTLFFAGVSLGRSFIDQQDTFAVSKLRSLCSGTCNAPASSLKEIEIDGLKGLEASTYDNHEGGKVTELIYQVLLFSDHYYYILIGRTRHEYEENLAVFKKIAKSFRRKRAPSLRASNS